MDLPEIVKERIEFVSKYIGTDTSDWLVVKHHISLSLPKTHRGLFSRRHKTTKKQIVNEFDKLVMNYWKQLTGIDLILEPSKIHDPNWVKKPDCWGLNRGTKRYYEK